MGDRGQRQDQPEEGGDLPSRARSGVREVARNEDGHQENSRQPREHEELKAPGLEPGAVGVRVDELLGAPPRDGKKRHEPHAPRLIGPFDRPRTIPVPP